MYPYYFVTFFTARTGTTHLSWTEVSILSFPSTYIITIKYILLYGYIQIIKIFLKITLYQ